jgi:hypothetical protein
MNKANPELAKMQDLSYWDSIATSSFGSPAHLPRTAGEGKGRGELVHWGD